MESKRIKILAIDDNQDNLISINALIREAFPDALILTALTGTKGLKLAVAENPDVILLDIVMPDMDGFEVCKELKANKELSDIPVVFVTAIKGDKESRIRALECGAEAFLTKPIDESELTAQIRAMVKIKTANIEKYTEKELLAALVIERTRELKENHIATLNLLDDLRKENAARQISEEAFRESQSLYHSFLDQLPNAVFRKDREGRYILVNSHFCRLKGLKKEDLIGKTPKEVATSEIAIQGEKLHATKYAGVGENIHELILQTGKVFEEEEEYPTTDGGTQYMQVVRMPVVDSYGTIIGTQGILFDITERKKAEELIRESEERFRMVFENVFDGIVIYEEYPDLSQRKLIDCNEQYAAMSGLTRKELFKYGNTNNIQISLEESSNDARLESLSTKKVFRGSYSWIRPDGKDNIIEFIGVPVMWRGKSYTIGIDRDITESKKAEADLIAAKEKAEESDRLKSAFLANMSHEIRTPMNGILGFAELLKEPKLTGEEQQTYISIIEKSGNRMLNIINDIVDISKIESGQMKISISKTNVNEQIEYINIFLKPEVERKGMQLCFNNSLPAEEATIETDTEKVYSILTNLVKNAIKFSDKGTIEFGYNLVETQHAKSLQFFVKDTGIGIPKDRQEAIFDRFVQADISDKKAFQGAGLGLAISKAYVEMLGGKIWVESNEGKGSTFYFTIPYNGKREEKNVIKNVVMDEVPETQIRDLKILIADDDEISTKIIAMAVRVFGKEVLKAINGVEAVEACRNHSDIDLVIMDIKMPEMDGYEATRQIRQFNTDVIIIAQTAYALTGDRETAREAGCNDYISKPIRKNQFMGLMQKYFKK